MAEISSNQQLATASENTKAAKTSSDSTAPTSIRTRKQTYKYSNESTVSSHLLSIMEIDCTPSDMLCTTALKEA